MNEWRLIVNEPIPENTDVIVCMPNSEIIPVRIELGGIMMDYTWATNAVPFDERHIDVPTHWKYLEDEDM